jgi:hypothetical protein
MVTQNHWEYRDRNGEEGWVGSGTETCSTLGTSS